MGGLQRKVEGRGENSDRLHVPAISGEPSASAEATIVEGSSPWSDLSDEQVGFLVPLRADLSEDASAEKLPILAGANLLGRGNLAAVDKRVSRRQLVLHASDGGAAELVVVGDHYNNRL